MEEFAKKKGKEGTRGAKQIAKENSETILFYRNMIIGSNAIYFLIRTLFGLDYSGWDVGMFLLTALIHIGCFQMEEFAKKKGKEGTRGAKQIAKENSETILFYRNMIIGSNAIYFLIRTLFGLDYSGWDVGMFLLTALIHIGCFQFLNRTGTPTLGPSGQLVDPGLDLNMVSGLAEHVKDLIILTSGVQILSLLTNYLWLLLLLAPLRAALMAWTLLIAPWLFAPAPEKTEMDDKKQRKMDRKMRRMQ
eukprot:snap_masked-scaffold1635_size32709-processed-gene-0.9 protein:Tk07225 transcript:snap_masked-scaffold1635_size32709-processed-gene-0.9-mRNA-1 annotation:"transmembrane protein 208"